MPAVGIPFNIDVSALRKKIDVLLLHPFGEKEKGKLRDLVYLSFCPLPYQTGLKRGIGTHLPSRPLLFP